MYMDIYVYESERHHRIRVIEINESESHDSSRDATNEVPHTCMYVCIQIYIYIFVYICTRIYTYMYIHACTLRGTVTEINESESHHRCRDAADELPHIRGFEAHNSHAVDLNNLVVDVDVSIQTSRARGMHKLDLCRNCRSVDACHCDKPYPNASHTGGCVLEC